MSVLAQLHPGLRVRTVPYRAMGIWLNRQLVVVSIPTGLWIHSPIPWTPELRSELATLGEVRHVIGPNCFHDECLKEFQAEYPAATFHAAPGLAAARRDLRFAPQPLSDTPHPDWGGTLEQHLIRGMPNLNEVIFFHRESRSLIIADIAMNIGPPKPLLTAVLMRLSGAWNKFTPTAFAKTLMKDPAAVRASIDSILKWDFDRIIVGHGWNIDTGGKDALRAAFAFLK